MYYYLLVHKNPALIIFYQSLSLIINEITNLIKAQRHSWVLYVNTGFYIKIENMTKYYIVNITLFTLYMHMYSAVAVYKAVKKYLTILLRSCRGYIYDSPKSASGISRGSWTAHAGLILGWFVVFTDSGLLCSSESLATFFLLDRLLRLLFDGGSSVTSN